MIDINKLLEKQKNKITEWHQELILSESELPWKYIEENHQYNFLLWHEEDIARIKDIDSLRIVQAKRSIDKYNQARNNAMEKIDEWILSFLQSQNIVMSGQLHSETPGMMIDRLSIMSLKRYHMFEETIRKDVSDEHINQCLSKVSVLDEQINDLSACLKDVFKEIKNGELRFKVYRQFKMYNDPSLNPALYNQNKK